MTTYLIDLIDKMSLDKGKKFNILVKKGIINEDYVVSEVIESGEGYQYLLLAKYGNLSKENKKLLAIDLVKKKATIIVYNYARDIEDAPISILEDSIIKSKDAYYIYLFAKNIKGADINKLEEAIIKTNNPEYIYLFARDVEYADIDILLNKLIELKNPQFLFAYARDVVGAPLEKIEEALLEIGDRTYYNLFIKFKKEKQDMDYEMLNRLINDENYEEIIEQRSKYSYLFEEVKVKKLIKQNNR